LAEGIRTLLLHPELPTCKDCSEWVYGSDWQKVNIPRLGGPQRRDPGEKPPCHRCPKSRDKENPNPEADLQGWGYDCLGYYRQCEVDPAAQFTPRDRITIRNNALIRGLEVATARNVESQQTALLAVAAIRSASGGR
jgi:hypothetical protein